MSYQILKCTFVIFLIGFLFEACSEEVTSYDSQIIGSWELTEGQRDTRPAPYLEGTFFEFYEDGSLITNFNLDASIERCKYEVENDQIQQLESDLNLVYTINSLNDSLLMLTTTLKNAKFKLLLRKKEFEE